MYKRQASFKEKADFGQIIGSIVGFGTDFSRLADEEQWQYLVGYLHERPCLLVWDNFETVAGYPEGAQPLATEKERETLSKFVKALRSGKSRVLITTRKQNEDWLGIALELIELGGLTRGDAGLLAKEILKTVGRKPEEYRQDPQYSELIKLLRGHPRSLEVVLPHLRSRSPQELIDAIQHRVDDLGDSLEDASLTYAFQQLSEKAQKHLPFLGLFVSHVLVATLEYFMLAGGEQERAYLELMGETIDATEWIAVLGEATSCGLLSSLLPRAYGIHPTMPAFLRRQLVSRIGDEGLKGLDVEFMRSYAALAAEANRRLEAGAYEVIAAIDVEEPNFLRALRLAEAHEDWSAAQSIVSVLAKLYGDRGRTQEWDALGERVQRSVGCDAPSASDRSRAALWLYLLGRRANRALDRQQLSVAEAAVLTGLGYLASLDEPEAEERMAVGYHQLGIIAQERNRYNEAEGWFRKAMEIRERLGLEASAAEDYFHLGRIAQAERRFEDAWEWYSKAHDVFKRHRLEREAARADHQLGRISEERMDLDDAERRYRNALSKSMALGLEGEAAYEHHHLGAVALKRKALDRAERSFRRSLEIRERLRLDRDAASDYHFLGIIAQEKGRLDKADEWYGKALEKVEMFEEPILQVSTLAQLGMLRRLQGRPREAVSCLGKALAITAQYEESDRGQILVGLARLMQEMGAVSYTHLTLPTTPYV